jgi:hypothetical protein
MFLNGAGNVVNLSHFAAASLRNKVQPINVNLLFREVLLQYSF